MRQANEITITVGNASVNLLPPNPWRRSIVVSTQTNPVFLTQNITATSGNGIQVRNDNMPTILCCRDTGAWLTKALFAIAPAGNTLVTVIEVVADPNGDLQDRVEGLIDGQNHSTPY